MQQQGVAAPQQQGVATPQTTATQDQGEPMDMDQGKATAQGADEVAPVIGGTPVPAADDKTDADGVGSSTPAPVITENGMSQESIKRRFWTKLSTYLLKGFSVMSKPNNFL